MGILCIYVTFLAQISAPTKGEKVFMIALKEMLCKLIMAYFPEFCALRFLGWRYPCFCTRPLLFESMH